MAVDKSHSIEDKLCKTYYILIWILTVILLNAADYVMEFLQEEFVGVALKSVFSVKSREKNL